jgi:hypothetical protein
MYVRENNMKHTKDTPDCVPGKALSKHRWRKGPALDRRQGKVYRGGIICCGGWGREGSKKGNADGATRERGRLGVVLLESDLCLS